MVNRKIKNMIEYNINQIAIDDKVTLTIQFFVCYLQIIACVNMIFALRISKHHQQL